MPVSSKRTDGGRIKGQATIPGIEVDLLWNLANGKLKSKNVLGGIVAGGFVATSAIAQAVYAAIIGSGAWTAWAAYVHTTAAFAGVQLRDLRSLNMPYVASTGGATPGTGANSALASSLAVVVNLPTQYAGRGERGRIYLPGLDSGAEIAGTGLVLGAAVTAAQNFVAEVQSALNAQGIQLALKQPGRQEYQGITGAIHPARAAHMEPITTPVVKTLYFASQRRRSQS